MNPTVYGSEIRRSPVEVGSSSQEFKGFLHPRWCRMSSINSMDIAIVLLFYPYLWATIQFDVRIFFKRAENTN